MPHDAPLSHRIAFLAFAALFGIAPAAPFIAAVLLAG
jgi:hypothetical protein